MEEETDILSQQEMPPAVFALLDSTTELIKVFSQPFHSFFCKDDNPKYKNHINVITADKLAVIHLPSSSFIHTSLVFSLCGLFFCLYFSTLWNSLQSELQLSAYVTEHIFLPSHGLGHMKRWQSRIFNETLYAIMTSFFSCTACDKAHFGVMYWAKHLAFGAMNI